LYVFAGFFPEIPENPGKHRENAGKNFFFFPFGGPKAAVFRRLAGMR